MKINAITTNMLRNDAHFQFHTEFKNLAEKFIVILAFAIMSTSLIGCGEEKLVDSRDGKKYKTVKIGEQVWMAENLNYDAEGSKCYDNKPANCKKYGRLYDWNTALKVCPSGWHLPNKEEWNVLGKAVGDGKVGKLKSKSGWNDYKGKSGNGTDNYGFSALPGGYGNWDGHFRNAGSDGYWWGEIEFADSYHMGYDNENASYSGNGKADLYSVRCLQNYKEWEDAEKEKAKIEEIKATVQRSSFTDNRDEKTYKAVNIGEQIWMAENLNYKPKTGNSWCYGNQASNCTEYGRLYDWATAMALPSSCNKKTCANQINTPHRGICPEGWHIPTNDEWDKWSQKYDLGAIFYSGHPDYFSAQPGGGLRSNDGKFIYIKFAGYWWSANEDSNPTHGSYMYYNNYEELNSGLFSHYKLSGFSVRCLKD